MNCLPACFAGLAEDVQCLDALQDGKAGNASGRAKGPGRAANAELACRHAGLETLADGEFRPNRVEHDGSAMHDAEHPPADFGAVTVECDPVDCCDRPVVDRAECRDQRRHAIGLAGAFISPRTSRVKSQNAASEIVAEPEFAMHVEVSLSERSPRVPSLIPDCNRALDTNLIVLTARPLRCFAVDRCPFGLLPLRRVDAPVLLVAWFPLGEAEPLPDMVLADDRIVARERMNYKTARRCWLDADRKRTIEPAMAGTGRQDLAARNFATQCASNRAKIRRGHRRAASVAWSSSTTAPIRLAGAPLGERRSACPISSGRAPYWSNSESRMAASAANASSIEFCLVASRNTSPTAPSGKHPICIRK